MIKKYFVILAVVIGIFYIFLPQKYHDSFLIMKDSDLETKVHIVDSRKTGPVIFVIAGIHGNEIAGIHVAESLSKYTPKKGKLIILPRANKVACDHQQRTMYYMQDLNREFPGKEQGTTTQNLAYEIVNVIKKYKPKVIFDLHESAQQYQSGEYFLGNSLIFTPISSSSELVMYILEKMNKGKDLKSKFTYFAGTPKGSINNEISNGLDIPVITIETNMKLPVEVRKKQHLDIVKTGLKYYGMDE